MATIKGGDKLEAALKKIVHNVRRGAVVKVGFLENAKYPDGTSVAMVAAVQDFGTNRAGPNHNTVIPPRPFFRNMVAAKSPEWPAAIAGLLRDNDYDAAKALDIAGFAIAGQLRESIINTNAPPLSPVTIQRKGFSKPLIETSHMINSVDHEVDTK